MGDVMYKLDLSKVGHPCEACNGFGKIAKDGYCDHCDSGPLIEIKKDSAGEVGK